MGQQPGFFDLDERYRKLSEVGDPLTRLKELVDFEVFRPALAAALKRSDGAKGGRPPYDAVLMFKILILQTLYTLSDDATEFQIRDRFSFMRFLGLELHDAVPDAKTIWLYREQLAKAGAIDGLFESFDAHLKAQGFLAMSGQIVDATIVAAPRQRNTEDEKKAIKDGRIPDDWKDKPKKLAQKDRDARWTLKRAKARPAKDGEKAKVEIAIPVFGYTDRTPEESWLAPTFDEWRRVADLAAQYSDDGDLDLGGEQMPWQIQSIVIGGAAPLDASGVRVGCDV